MVSQRGFSLIELLVVLALLGFLLSLAVPFASSWSNQSKLQDAAQLLQQGIGRTKALALRNEYGIRPRLEGNIRVDKTVAILCLASTTPRLNIYTATMSAEAATCSGTAAWSAELPQALAITNADKNFTCLALNSRGLPININNCSTKSEYTLSIGGESETVTFN